MAQTSTRREGWWAAVAYVMHPPPVVTRFALRYLVPLIVGVVLLADFGYAVNWVVVPDSEHRSAAYDVIRALPIESPIAVLGAVLGVWTLLTAGTLMHMKACYWGSYGLVLGCAYWTGWAIVTTISVIGADGAAGFFPITTVLLAAVHLLLGAVWPARRTVSHVGPHPHVPEEVARRQAGQTQGV